ncbi:thrombopoietin receptor-like [Lethenteron reissneri]|uniref:thrombopoietin receptor-like n=1 Tax=Lethenteron reissneri TaxID=7753 RepID=UPI002AB7B3B1|nr:thrombopoietin receptor-like [Lethenteron reissneri]
MAGSSVCVVAALWALGPLLAAGFVSAAASTEEDGGGVCAMLLRAPGCLTRRGFDFECTWDLLRPDLVTTSFTYHFAGERLNNCHVTVQRRLDNASASYACAIPARQVSMFQDLVIEMRAWHGQAGSSCRTRSTVRVEEAVHTEPPRALWARGTEWPGELRAGWTPPEADIIVTSTLTYQLSYSRERNRTNTTVQTGATEHRLRGLRPGIPYWLRVRTGPDGETLRGSWSEWSQPVMATPRASPGGFHLQCATRDLRTLLCHWASVSPGSNYSLYYQDEELGSEWKCGSESARWGSQEEPGSRCSLSPPSPLTRVRLSVRQRDPPRHRVLITEPFCMADVDPNGALLGDRTNPQTQPGGVRTEMGGGELRLSWSESGLGAPGCDGGPDQPCTDVRLGEGEGSHLLEGAVKGAESRGLQAPDPSEGVDRAGWRGGWGGSGNTVAVVTNASERPGWTLAYVIPFALLMSAVLVVIKGRMRRIKQKVWPAVPDLESSFDELFTVFKGNFQEWARPERGGRIVVRPACEVEERLICLVEVVSEGDQREEQEEQAEQADEEEMDKREEVERRAEGRLPLHAWPRRKAQNAYVLRGGDAAGRQHGEREAELLSPDLHGYGDEEDAGDDGGDGDDVADAVTVDENEVGAAHDDDDDDDEDDDDDDADGLHIATASAGDDDYEDAADEDNVPAADEDCNAAVDNEDADSTDVLEDDADAVAEDGDHDEDNDEIAGNEDAHSTYDYYAYAEDVADDDDEAAVGSVHDVGAAAAATSDENNDDYNHHHRRPTESRSEPDGEVSENPGILPAPGKRSQDPYPGVQLLALRYERVWWGIGGGQPELGCRRSPVNSRAGGGGGKEGAGRAATLEVAGSQEITNMAYVMRKEAGEAGSGGYVNAT